MYASWRQLWSLSSHQTVMSTLRVLSIDAYFFVNYYFKRNLSMKGDLVCILFKWACGDHPLIKITFLLEASPLSDACCFVNNCFWDYLSLKGVLVNINLKWSCGLYVNVMSPLRVFIKWRMIFPKFSF